MGRGKSIRDEQILEAARTVFIESGSAASTAEIARVADISEGLIFRRFSTKTDLFFAAMSIPGFDTGELFKPLGMNETIELRLEQIALALIDYFREILPILLTLVTHPSFDYEKFTESPLSRVHDELSGFLKELAELGHVSSENYPASGQTLVATMHSLALFEAIGVHGGAVEDATVHDIVRTIWLGLKP